MSAKVKIWFRVVLAFAVSAVAIVWSLPRDSKFSYDYSLGQPWHYSPLIADHEFAIKKSDERLQRERDSVKNDFHPYFKLNEAAGEQSVKNFKADYVKGKFAGVPDAYFQYALKRLEEIYKVGVVEVADYNYLTKNNFQAVSIIDGRIGTLKLSTTIFSPRTAYESVMGSESYSRDMLTRLQLNNYLVANLLRDSVRTNKSLQDLYSSIPLNEGIVLAGERIIDRGERVTARQLLILDSLKKEIEAQKKDATTFGTVFFGQVGLVCLIIGLYVGFLKIFRRDFFVKSHSLFLLITLITVFPVAMSLLLTYKYFSVYILPFAMVPIIVRIFMDTRIAFMTHVVTISLASIALSDNYHFVMTQIVVGLVAIYSLKELTARSQLLYSSFIVTVAAWTFGFLYELSQGSKLSELDVSWYWFIGINGVLLLFTYPLLYIIERAFGFTSSVTLIEMSNVNSPLMRRMAKEAHGTFVHSMQVGNLAAEVAAKIGAKVQLVRTAALYHDIGKLTNPAFFTENQGGVSPHKDLPEERSAELIISHVTEGLRMAEQEGLPKEVSEFIITHHGRSMVRYFYVQACNKYGKENVNPDAFTYPGRNPYTLEQGIFMMADAIEASSRSLQKYTEESITELVNRIIDGQVDGGYFKECPITFRDINDAKRVFIDSLKTIYHTRIAYPELNAKEKAKEEEKSSAEIVSPISAPATSAAESASSAAATENGASEQENS